MAETLWCVQVNFLNKKDDRFWWPLYFTCTGTKRESIKAWKENDSSLKGFGANPDATWKKKVQKGEIRAVKYHQVQGGGG